MKVTVILIIIVALGPVLKNLENKLEELEIRKEIATNKTALLKSAGILKSPGHLMRQIFTQIPVKKSQL